MVPKYLYLPILTVLLFACESPAFAQRGGRGGGAGRGSPHGGEGGGARGGEGGGMSRGGPGGMERGGGSGSGERSGGFGGGLSRSGSESMGSTNRGGSSLGMEAGGAARPGMGAGSAGRPGMGSGGEARPGMGAPGAGRPGTGAGGIGGPSSGVGVRPGAGAGRPGVGAGGVGGPSSGVGVRPGAGAGTPGVGAGGVGGPYSGVGVRPGAGAGPVGLGAGGVGGPASGVGVLPGAGAGLPGNPAAYAAARPNGTYYAGDTALAAQRDAVVAGAYAYPAYSAAAYAAYPGAWQPTNLANNSLYGSPGYSALASSMGLATQPISYDYGANIVTQPNVVYVNGDPAGTPQEYSNQAAKIAEAGGAQPDSKLKWTPLGVFTMVDGNETNSNDVFQLAVNNQGTIRGNYHNLQTNETTPVAGSVDPKTQRTAWTIGGDSLPVYEAGFANLMKDQTTMIVHTPDGQQRQFTLIRLPEPQQTADDSPGK